MKTVKRIIWLILIGVLFSFNGITKDLDSSSIPAKVMEKFKSSYPEITKEAVWKKKFNKYQVDFIINNKSTSLLFNKHADIINSKIEIDKTELPIDVLNQIQKNYIDKYYKVMYVMKRLENNEVLYETEVMKGRRLLVVRYNITGKVVNVFELDKRDILNMPSFCD